MTLRILGVRHHSPACARLAAHLIERERPTFVLIEGPSDFNPRLAELLLDHRLPIALYSYSVSDTSPSQCWFPFLEYSPEWVALRAGHRRGAQVRFIDLPHWRYRTLPDARKRIASVRPERARPRYQEVVGRLCERFHCDGDYALWDHLFESLPHDAHDELLTRLDSYFHEVRGEEPGSEQDQAREDCMARWIAWALHQKPGERVLVICGGWHKRALETRVPALGAVATEPVSETPCDPRQAGSYLVPYEFRQVDALGGYGAGMQSPLFYQWAWHDGAQAAHRRAVRHIVERLRRRQATVSTADLVAFERQTAELSRLRGHADALRIDILDALQSTVIKEALSTPPPWSARGLLSAEDHPSLREALLALTGEDVGKLHAETPLPPLLHDVQAELDRVGLKVERKAQTLVLDRRRGEDGARAEILWQLETIGVSGLTLRQTAAPNAARNLPVQLRFEEHWSVAQTDRWFPDLIEASAWGATLRAAARNRLLDLLHSKPDDPATLSRCMLSAVRAGLLDMGLELAEQLRGTVSKLHDHAELGRAAHVLLEVAHAGFWGSDTRALMEGTLVLMAERVLWLLETHQTSSAKQLAGDVDALCALDSMLRMQITNLDAQFVLETLHRFALTATKPPAVRGAALGICHVHGALGAETTQQLLAVTRSIPVRDALGDFLYGLFSCARALAIESDTIVRALHGAVEGMTTEDFLVALPQLRGAFAWFPPRERGALAAMAATLLGLSKSEQQRLTGGVDKLLDARQIEAQALQWARALGVLE